MSIYADTSFLVSLYAPDIHSPPAARFMHRALLPVLITPLGELEFLNALHLRIFRGELSASEVKAATSLFRKDTEAAVFSLQSLSATAFERAKTVVRARTPSLGTRTLDVLHVACALVLRTEVFCTFDKNQRQLAKLEGLTTPL